MAGSFETRLGNSPEEGIKAPCVVATQSNITLAGEQTIETVAVVSGDRVLVRAQTNPVENGIYNADGSAWSRSHDFNDANDVANGVLVVDASTTRVYQAVYTGLYSPGVTLISFDLSIFVPGSLTSVSESVTLSDGQTTVNLTNTTVTYASIFINGHNVDNGRLTTPGDYNYVQATGVVTLTDSYPSGTVLTAIVHGI